jgi:hypothetical protein
MASITLTTSRRPERAYLYVQVLLAGPACGGCTGIVCSTSLKALPICRKIASMPEDLSTLGLSIVGAQNQNRHRRSEASLSDDSSTVPTNYAASASLTSSEARIRTGGTKSMGSGDWTLAGRRGSNVGVGFRRSKFDIRHDNMLASLLKKRQRTASVLTPSTNPPVDRVSPGDPSAPSSSSSSFSTCDPEDSYRSIQHAPSADSASTKSSSATGVSNASSDHSSLRRPASTNTTPEATPSKSKVGSNPRFNSASETSPEAMMRVNSSLVEVRNNPRANIDDQVSKVRRQGFKSGDGTPVSLVSVSVTLTDDKQSRNGIAATEKSDEIECASLVSGESNEEDGESTLRPLNCDSAGRGDNDAEATKPDGSPVIASDGALIQNRIMMTVGTRVEVYWDGEGQYFAGTLTKASSRHNRGDCFFIEYDDGDKEWIHLDREIYRLEENPKPNRTAGGSDVAASKRSKSQRDSRRSSGSGPKKNGVASSECSTKNAVFADKHISSDSVDSVQGSVNCRATSTTTQQRQRLTSGWNASRDAPTTGTFREAELISGVKLSEKAQPIVVGSSIGANFGNEAITQKDENWVRVAKRSPEDSSDSETDEEELLNWATKLFGISPRPIARRKSPPGSSQPRESIVGDLTSRFDPSDDVFIPISEAVKLGRRRRSVSLNSSAPHSGEGRQKRKERVVSVEEEAEEERSKRRKEEAKPLTQAEVKAILSHDLCPEAASQHWVRRSMRQPSRSALDSPQVKALLDKLRSNDTDMVVLKLKKYVSDPNAPQIVLDAVLDALEENTNCEALYIQVRHGPNFDACR